MSRNGRKQITTGELLGVASDGGLIFEVAEINHLGNWKTTLLKVVSYEEGIMEIAIDCKLSVTKIGQLISGMFSEESNFGALNVIILNYNNISIKIEKTTNQKDIIYMIRQEMSKSNYKSDVSVDTEICRKNQLLRNSDSVELEYEEYEDPIKFTLITSNEKNLLFRDYYTGRFIFISSIKDGIVTISSIRGCYFFDIIEELRQFFVPYCKFYGVKAVDFRINRFSIRVDETNIDRILYLYDMFCVIFDNSKEMENFN